jgi:hypothetical protein
MQSTPEYLKQDLDHLSAPQLQQVADFIAFLKFRDRSGRTVEPSQFAALAEFADDDRAMAEAGMNDYASSLVQED